MGKFLKNQIITDCTYEPQSKMRRCWLHTSTCCTAHAWLRGVLTTELACSSLGERIGTVWLGLEPQASAIETVGVAGLKSSRCQCRRQQQPASAALPA